MRGQLEMGKIQGNNLSYVQSGSSVMDKTLSLSLMSHMQAQKYHRVRSSLNLKTQKCKTVLSIQNKLQNSDCKIKISHLHFLNLAHLQNFVFWSDLREK